MFRPPALPALPGLPVPADAPALALGSNVLGWEPELELHAADKAAANKSELIPTATRTLRGMLRIEHQ